MVSFILRAKMISFKSDIKITLFINNLALYFRELGMPEGLHCEGAALHSLLGLLLWDQIYQVSGFQSGNVKQFVNFL